MKHKKIAVIFGTRPEAIKLAPVILALKENPRFKYRVCVTAQHRELLALNSEKYLARIIPMAMAKLQPAALKHWSNINN